MFYKFSEAQVIMFALVLLRMIGFVVSSAVFGSPNVNAALKVLLSLVLSILIFPTIKISAADAALLTTDVIILAAREVLIGLSLGFLTRLFFFTVGMTGEFVSISIGLGAAQIYNPMTGSHSNTIEQFYFTLGTLVFFALNGHHFLIGGIAQSYELVPLAQNKLNIGPFSEIAVFAQDMMVMAIKMCAPIFGAILITNVAMGILGRAIPQINVLITSMPVTIMLGLAIMFICAPLLLIEMHGVIDITESKLLAVMKALSF